MVLFFLASIVLFLKTFNFADPKLTVKIFLVNL